MLHTVWKYRTEIILGIQLIQRLRKSAREVAQEYIRRRVAESLKRALVSLGLQLSLFGVSCWLVYQYPSLFSRLIASTVLWAVTIYNALCFVLVTIPELRAVRKTLRGKTGYALKYFLQVSVVTELLQLNVFFLVFCWILGWSSRTYLSASFSYFQPWLELLGYYRPL